MFRKLAFVAVATAALVFADDAPAVVDPAVTEPAPVAEPAPAIAPSTLKVGLT